MATKEPSKSKSTLMSESAQAYNQHQNNKISTLSFEIVKLLSEKPLQYCCNWGMKKIFILWNIWMTGFNMATSGFFFLFLILTFTENQGIVAYAVISAICRTLMNAFGFWICFKFKYIQNVLFLFTITAVLFTILFDIVFLVYFSYIQYEVAIVGAVFIWIIDILVVSYLAFVFLKNLKFLRMDIKSEYHYYKKYFWYLIGFCFLLFFWGVAQTVYTLTGSATIRVLQEHYSIEYYISHGAITRAKQLQTILYNNSISIVYVCSDEGVYALIDWENDQKNDDIYRILPPISRSCTSVAVDTLNDYLYITEWEKTYQCFTNTNSTYANIHEQVLKEQSVVDSCNLWFEQEYYPYHGWHLTELNHNNQLCISEGVACNLCEPVYPQGEVICFNDMENPSFENSTSWAVGVRDVVGITFDESGTMWITDHNTDMMGDNTPDCELNKVSLSGEHFGFPYCHTNGFGNVYKRNPAETELLVDSLYGIDINYNCSYSKYTSAIQPVGPHVAPNGLMFVNSMSNETHKTILIAQHGSWNRRKYIGYRVAKVVIDINDNVVAHEIFIDGFLNVNKQLYSGRPMHLAELSDGSILLSDDVAHTVYRIYYDEENENQKTITQKCVGGHSDKIKNWYRSYEREG